MARKIVHQLVDDLDGSILEAGDGETVLFSLDDVRAGQRDYAPVRAWAADNGYALSERGRVPAAVLEAYDDAH